MFHANLQLRESEKVANSERVQRQHASDQVKLLVGDNLSSLAISVPNLHPTKIAEASLAILDGCLDVCEESMIRTLRDGQGALPVENDSEQRTALGIVLNDTRVDATVLGSPAFACGLIHRLDEVLMVDGQKVDGDTAMTALRGDDEVGAVVSILLRKVSTGEVYTVLLPRVDITTLKTRQDLYEDLAALHSEAILAIQTADSTLLIDRLGKIKEIFEDLDRSNLEIQQRLSAQVGLLKETMRSIASKCRTAILDVDTSHQQVHILQFMMESELRQNLAGIMQPDEGNESKEGQLHTQIQELEGDLKLLQEELNATQMLRREALELADKYRFKVLNF